MKTSRTMLMLITVSCANGQSFAYSIRRAASRKRQNVSCTVPHSMQICHIVEQ